MARLARGPISFGTEKDTLIDRIVDQINRLSGMVEKLQNPVMALSAEATAVPIYNNGTVSFVQGLIGGYNSTGHVVLATAASSGATAARFVSLGTASPKQYIQAVSSGLALVQTDSAPTKRGQIAWLSNANPGKATPTMPTSGSRQMLGVFEQKDAKTGLWSLLLGIDPQLAKGLG